MLSEFRPLLFNSWQFLVFFPTVTALYFALPHRFRWLLLLVASCIFYMAFIPAYLLILAFTILVDYAAGLLIATAEGPRRKLWLVVSICANLGILGFFKYFNFFNDNVRALAEALHWNYPIGALSILLPIGLSFHIFQSLSYTIEVYRGHQAPERHLGIFALYVMFYPQLVAGPIERPQNLLHQFRTPMRFDAHRVALGLQLMLWGFFMKVMIADRLALVVNPVFAEPTQFTGITLMAASVAFSFQIFCDFAGYSSIAIGAAQVMGFTLMKNFNRPYFSKSIREFWTRCTSRCRPGSRTTSTSPWAATGCPGGGCASTC
jgi:D-alanyl-lipoteichoic acid acyltransferase DltB (MBOAT superfamily)